MVFGFADSGVDAGDEGVLVGPQGFLAGGDAVDGEHIHPHQVADHGGAVEEGGVADAVFVVLQLEVGGGHLGADDFGHPGAVDHGEAVHDQGFHLFLAAGVGVADVGGDGMVDTADLLPVGDFARVDLSDLVGGQVPDGVFRIDDEYQCVDGQRGRHQIDTRLGRGSLLVPGDIPACDDDIGMALDQIHVGPVRAAAEVLA